MTTQNIETLCDVLRKDRISTSMAEVTGFETPQTSTSYRNMTVPKISLTK